MSDVIGCKVIWGRASSHMRKCANISPYMRRPFVIDDFAPDPSKFPYLWGNLFSFFYQFLSCPWTHSFERFLFYLGTHGGGFWKSGAESAKVWAFLKSRWLHTLTFTLGCKELRILHLGHQTSTKHMLLTATKTMHSWRTFIAQYPLQRLSSKTLCQQPLTEPGRSWQGYTI